MVEFTRELFQTQTCPSLGQYKSGHQKYITDHFHNYLSNINYVPTMRLITLHNQLNLHTFAHSS